MSHRWLRFALLAASLACSAAAAADSGRWLPGWRTGLMLTLVPVATPSIKIQPKPLLAQAARRALGESCVGAAVGPRALGDLVTMRRPDTIAIDDTARRRLSAAYLSQDPAVSKRILAPLRSSPDRSLTYLATLTALHVQIAAGQSLSSPEVAGEFEALESLRADLPFSTADTDFLEALRSLSQGRLERARDMSERALRTEPEFFNAHVIRILVQLRITKLVGVQANACGPALERLASMLADLTTISPCPMQAVYTDAFFRSEGSMDASDPSFLLLEAYFATLARNPGALRAVRDRASSWAAGQEASRCTGLIMHEVETLHSLLAEHAKPERGAQ